MAKHVDEYQAATDLSATYDVAIQVRNKDGLALGTYVSGVEVDASADGPLMAARAPYHISPVPTFDPVPTSFALGEWDEDRRRFDAPPNVPEFSELEELKSWLGRH